MKAAGMAADGVVWVMCAATWHEDVPGMAILREISRMSDPEGKAYRTVHYLRGVCAMFFMKEAMEWADVNGGISGPNIRRAMYQRREWVPTVSRACVCLELGGTRITEAFPRCASIGATSVALPKSLLVICSPTERSRSKNSTKSISRAGPNG